MPKRIVDGEALWTSKKLRRVEPEWYRAEYANLIPLALANGVFEYDPQAIWAKVYAANRPSVTPDDVRKILESYGIHKLIFRFRADSDGSEWGFWVGIDRPGRLPSEVRWGKNEKVGPAVPRDQLVSFLMDTNGIHEESNGIPRAGARGVGSGVGVGVGSGTGTTPPVGSADAPKRKPVASPIELPEWLPTEPWFDYVAHRLLLHKPLKSESQVKYCIRDLEKLRKQGHDPGAVLAQSIANGWTGLFEIKNGGNHGETVADQNRRNAAAVLERYEARVASAAGAGGDAAPAK